MGHDPANTPIPDFPRLTPTNHRVTSPADETYNCTAWAAGVSGQWWQPGNVWPGPDTDPEYEPEALARVYQGIGFVPCPDGSLEPGCEKVALYSDDTGEWSHAARQLPTGKWTSKLGNMEDIEHDTPEDVAGGPYGEVFAYLKRPLPPVS